MQLFLLKVTSCHVMALEASLRCISGLINGMEQRKTKLKEVTRRSK